MQIYRIKKPTNITVVGFLMRILATLILSVLKHLDVDGRLAHR